MSKQETIVPFILISVNYCVYIHTFFSTVLFMYSTH